MESIQDWFQYVNRVSRPARREGGGTPAVQPWRPWHDTSDAAKSEPEPIPVLTALLAGTARSAASPRPHPVVSDPTLNDELEPVEDYQVPAFQAPQFDLSIPSLIEHPQAGQLDRDPGAVLSGEAAELPSLPQGFPALRAPSPVTAATADRAPWLWENLLQMRSRNFFADQEGGRGSREELIQRLMDPTLNLEETALLIGVCSTTVRRYTNKGYLPHFRTKGNQRRFRFLDVAEFIVNRQAEIEADVLAERTVGLPAEEDPDPSG